MASAATCSPIAKRSKTPSPDELRLLAKSRDVPDEPTHLRVERRYGRFKLSWSRDGQSWTSFAQMPDVGYAQRLQVGVGVVNATNVKFAPQFEQLQLVTREKSP